ncbi:MAG: hypothetical protein R3F29_11710 [Planctomycetota bacterium]
MLSAHELPAERPPVGCWALAAAVAVILWGFDLQWGFWILLCLIGCGLVADRVRRRAARRRGWAIAGVPPELVRYGRLVDGRWLWITFDVPGGGPEAFFGAEHDWTALPDWARRDRAQILQRLTARFPKLAWVESEMGARRG